MMSVMIFVEKEFLPKGDDDDDGWVVVIWQKMTVFTLLLLWLYKSALKCQRKDDLIFWLSFFRGTIKPYPDAKTISFVESTKAPLPPEFETRLPFIVRRTLVPILRSRQALHLFWLKGFSFLFDQQQQYYYIPNSAVVNSTSESQKICHLG